jgi:homoprotocatechuate degradation regulator HpaR
MEKSLQRRNLALLLLQGRERIMANFRRILNHHGLTEQQWRVLRAITDCGEPMEQSQICETCQIVSPSLAGVLSRMEEMGLVERTRVDTDQRRMLVALTAQSCALIDEIAPLIEQQYVNLEAAVGADVVHSLYRALDAFLAKPDKVVELVDLPAVPRAHARKAG